MTSLIALFSALTAFGLGVTIADLLGAFEHDESGSAHDDSLDRAIDTAHPDAPAVPGHPSGDKGSIAVATDSSAFVARAIGVLRTGVYFALGAGPTGLFGVFSKLSGLEIFAWSAGAGVLITILVRLIRKAIRNDLDSTLSIADFVMDECEVTVGFEAGGMGKVSVRRYGVEKEFYARAKDPSMGMGKGQTARIVDYDDSVCYVAPVSSESRD